MHITRLRLAGFKSFVEATDLVIERGLTGVVGPNGCGKSNLLEALRWVMGETSHKSMRAAAMDDVIFSGTTSRPARNWAEVTIHLDNRARLAPAGFNDSDQIEITRRIEREAGSAYRINGQDARARDMKVLFEDAATGARSPALVRQGQISEIVNAKPENRRRILEDAAGVAGLHTRRHEADLRLKAAEANLVRIGDVLGGLNSQVESLKRQARAARRYREISGDIRKLEALLLHGLWAAAHAEVEAEEAALAATLTTLAAVVETEAGRLTAEIRAAEVMPGLRQQEAERAAAVARITLELESFDRDLARAVTRRRDAEARLAAHSEDLAREAATATEAAETVERLEEALLGLAEADEGAEEAVEAAAERVERANKAAAALEAEVGRLTQDRFRREAQRRSHEATDAERQRQAERVRRQVAALDQQIADLAQGDAASTLVAEAEEELALATDQLVSLEGAAEDAAAALEASDGEARTARDELARTRIALAETVAERDTLAKLTRAGETLSRSDGPILDRIVAAPGYEIALGAALGAALEAGEAASEPAYWRLFAEVDRPAEPLPQGARPLGDHVTAPPALARRLARTGIVERNAGLVLQATLRPGQRLVSREGDMWRWDGLVVTADAAPVTAIRLAERARLGDLERRCDEAAANAAEAGARSQLADARHAQAVHITRRLQDDLRAARLASQAFQSRILTLQQGVREASLKRQTLLEARAEAQLSLDAAEERAAESKALIDRLVESDDEAPILAAAESRLQAARTEVTEARALAAGLAREQAMTRDQRRHTEAELTRWHTRAKAAALQAANLTQRHADALAELHDEDLDPDVAVARREALLTAKAKAEADRTGAAEALVTAEDVLRAASAALKGAQADVVREREARARIEARLEAARQKRHGEARRIRDTLAIAPEECLTIAGHATGAPLPPLADLDRDLQRAKADRERLGGVNLEAEGELATLEDQHSRLDAERADVEQAVAKLRGAIAHLNREGRKRLMEAFTTVDRHFRQLFETLFGGGEARLEMVEGEDPLEGGLEIIAKPPGKKPATLSLLSGGEQTLTALSLIFAVFLTNPSPICVLDEVDAPLDDANVDRFCTLMERMAEETETRFLVITHHPMTMARMNRLFGVTMAERGVSLLVSVDLMAATRLIETDAA